MTDIVTYCDVNTCEDCPRYGDDCDGDKRVEHTDYISRADAIKAVASITMSIHLSDVICDKLLALPSADAEPTVIRSRTLMPTKDFKEWAKRIRETNPNAVVIPCDAEVVSAEAEHGHGDGQWYDLTDALTVKREAVEVIRCGECKHHSVEGKTTHFGWCGYWNKPTDEMRFCSDGERNDHECVLSR